MFVVLIFFFFDTYFVDPASPYIFGVIGDSTIITDMDTSFEEFKYHKRYLTFDVNISRILYVDRFNSDIERLPLPNSNMARPDVEYVCTCIIYEIVILYYMFEQFL